ncbi:MAG TPA: hypothetical protein VFW07_23585 [Parafilimonas sp.]|nr:hypothetical protein [Parafilimonas sp.]
MNRFDTYIAGYLYDNKEVALEKIGIIKTLTGSTQDARPLIQFIHDKKATNSEGLINYIAERAGKNKNLIASDLESHLAQVREFINIGKNYEIPDIGFIKSNNSGSYEFLPYSEANKPLRISSQTVPGSRRNNSRSIVQLISFIIVIAILSGLGWQAYRFFRNKQTNSTVNSISNAPDTITNTNLPDTSKVNQDSTITQPVIHSENDTVNVRYIFERTASGMRARTRTAQLQNFGNNASYDSFTTNNTKFFDLYILKPTRLADTLAVKDSLSKFFQKDIRIVIEPANQ